MRGGVPVRSGLPGQRQGAGARHDDQGLLRPAGAQAGQHMPGARAADAQPAASAVFEQRGLLAAPLQGAGHQGLLGAAVAPQLGQRQRAVAETGQRAAPRGVVHGAAVVRVHQAEVPRFTALV